MNQLPLSGLLYVHIKLCKRHLNAAEAHVAIGRQHEHRFRRKARFFSSTSSFMSRGRTSVYRISGGYSDLLVPLSLGSHVHSKRVTVVSSLHRIYMNAINVN